MESFASSVLPFTVRYKGGDRDADLKHVARAIEGGAWEGVPDEDIEVSQISGGITNLLFKLTGPGSLALLVRIYGVNTDIMIDRERDNRLFNELGRMGFGPKFLGRFTNGRLEGYLPATPLEPQDMGQQQGVDFVTLIAKGMARMHSLKVTSAGPPGKTELWRTLSKWIKLAKGVTFEEEAKAAALAALGLDETERELHWLQGQLDPDHFEEMPKAGAKDFVGKEGMPGASPSVTPPPLSGDEIKPNGQKSVPSDVFEGWGRRYLLDVVFCHNDLLSGNILHHDGWDKVQIIDFEYSGHNYRGFDIANHFCEHAGFDSDFEKSFPTPEVQRAFIATYLSADFPGLLQSLPGDPQPLLEKLRLEAGRWTLAAHMFWGIWSVVQARYSPIDFDFLDYARLRLASGYHIHKREFFPTN
ncbi:unnamed protein product [Discosporangium mesarthrocarpum]